jgi:superfamily II DNA/RNA helicase
MLQIADNHTITRTIVFVNHRESAIRIADYLQSHKASVALYHGALQQIEREKAIATFNNGSTPILIATDLAARGLDIEEVNHIIHYHLPTSPQAYTHRNGRSARVNADGNIYVICGPGEPIPEYITFDNQISLPSELEIDHRSTAVLRTDTASIYIAAGKKEKISKGDVAGFLIKTGGLSMDEVGKINSYDHYTVAAIPSHKAKALLPLLNAAKLKGTRHKIHLIK